MLIFLTVLHNNLEIKKNIFRLIILVNAQPCSPDFQDPGTEL